MMWERGRLEEVRILVVLGDGGKMRAYPLFTYEPVRSVEIFYYF